MCSKDLAIGAYPVQKKKIESNDQHISEWISRNNQKDETL